MKTLKYFIGLLVMSGMVTQAALVGNWNFDDGTTNDAVTGITHRLIYRYQQTTATPVFTNDTPFGVGVGLALVLGQSNNTYVVGSTLGNVEPTNAATYAAWVKINGWTSTDNQWECIFSKQNGTAGGFRMGRTSTFAYSGVDFLGTGGGNARDSVTQVNIADNTWHHVAFTYNRTNQTAVFYIDGIQRASSTMVYNAATNALLVIGAWNTAGIRTINGLIDDIRIYDNDLSAAEIASLISPPATVLFSDNFNAANSTNLFDPTGRAVGTLATNQVYYAWTDTNDVVVDGTLNWDAQNLKTPSSNQQAANGTQNLRFGSAANSGYFDWYPYVGGKIWDVEYDTLTANNHPLNLGVTDTQVNGAYNGYINAGYNFAFGNLGTACIWGSPSNSAANIFPSRTTVYHIRVQLNELLGIATISVNGTNVATNNLVFISNHRYISWGEPTQYAGYIKNLQISVEPGPDVAPFAAIAAPSNLIPNGDFTQVANAVVGPNSTSPGNYNINGTFGDYPNFWGSTADVVGWSPFYNDPNGLTTNVVPFTDDPSKLLNTTYYLDTLINTGPHTITLNSADYYLNGLMATNVLDGVTIKSGAQYQLVVKAAGTASTEQYYATFAAALTAGSGANATNTATAVPNSLLSLWAHDLPTSGTTNLTRAITGADLLAAAGNGPVNMIFNQINTNGIAGYPDGSPEPQNPSQVSQVKVYGVGLTVVVPPNDLNHDGVVDQADVTVAQTYMNGNGGDSATNRENSLINTYGYTSTQALAYLNLTSFDINGDNYFDGSDVAALQAIVGPLIPPTLNYSVVAPGQIQFSWSGTYKLQWLTNTLGTGLRTNVSNGWVDYPYTTNPVTVTNNGIIPTAFFRLSQ